MAPQIASDVGAGAASRGAKGNLLSLCNLGPVARRSQIVCIHDLHTRMMPESYSASFRLAHRILLPLLGKKSARHHDRFRVLP